MLDADAPFEKADVARRDAAELTTYTKLMNFVPLAYLLAGISVVVGAGAGWAMRSLLAVVWIYLVPPLMARLVMLAFGRPYGRNLRQHDRAYRIWWCIFQFQVVLNRLPFLEELLRILPGVYALWLRLWGSRVSLLVYWSPGVRILDRNLVEVGDAAVLGVESALSGHAGRMASDGTYRVDIAPAIVEAGAILGARSGVGPGGQVRAGSMLPAGRGVRPFGQWPPRARDARAADTDEARAGDGR